MREHYRYIDRIWVYKKENVNKDGRGAGPLSPYVCTELFSAIIFIPQSLELLPSYIHFPLIIKSYSDFLS